MTESRFSWRMQTATDRAFASLIAPSHRAIIDEVASAGEAGCSFKKLLQLGSKQPALSQQLHTLTDAQLLSSSKLSRAALFRLGSGLTSLNRWFAKLELQDDLASERAARQHITLQPLFGCLGLPLCRAIVTELSGRRRVTGLQLSRTLDVSAPSRSRAITRMTKAGLVIATREHPHVSYALLQEAAWRAWDWVYDLAPTSYGE